MAHFGTAVAIGFWLTFGGVIAWGFWQEMREQADVRSLRMAQRRRQAMRRIGGGR